MPSLPALGGASRAGSIELSTREPLQGWILCARDLAVDAAVHRRRVGVSEWYVVVGLARSRFWPVNCSSSCVAEEPWISGGSFPTGDSQPFPSRTPQNSSHPGMYGWLFRARASRTTFPRASISGVPQRGDVRSL
jgi:hypothetical protein